MPKPHVTHRDMRQTILECRAAIALLLGVKEMYWEDKEYALYSIMSQMWVQSRKDNPTHSQVKVFTGAWLRFLARLIEAMPVGIMRKDLDFQFKNISYGYTELLTKKEGAK